MLFGALRVVRLAPLTAKRHSHARTRTPRRPKFGGGSSFIKIFLPRGVLVSRAFPFPNWDLLPDPLQNWYLLADGLPNLTRS